MTPEAMQIVIEILFLVLITVIFTAAFVLIRVSETFEMNLGDLIALLVGKPASPKD